MKKFIYILLKVFIFLLFILVVGCKERKDIQKKQNQLFSPKKTEVIDYEERISWYLKRRKIEPVLVFSNNGISEINMEGYNIKWRQNSNENGLEISINGKIIETKGKIALNSAWGEKRDSIWYLNNISQIKLYKYEQASIIAFLLIYHPCNGHGCSVNYQLFYDTKTGKESYFSRFRTGFELELYDFNYDQKIDFLSKRFDGRNSASMVDTTTFEMYSRLENGSFDKYKDSAQNHYWFRYIYASSSRIPNPNIFEEHWIEKIIKK